MEPFLLLYSILLILDILSDWYRIEIKGRQIKHDLETLGAALAYSIGTVLLVLFICRDNPQGVRDLFVCRDNPQDVRDLTLEALGLLALWVPIRWIFHDLLLNISRKLPFDYLGKEAQSAESDKLLARLDAKGWTQFAVKLLALLIGLLVCIVLNLVIFLI